MKWNVRVIMAQNDVRSAAELSRLLGNIDILISEVQMARIVNTKPNRLNLDVFEGICQVLNCTPNDLFGVGC